MVKMSGDEKILSYTNRASHLASILNSMEMDVDGSEIAMAVLKSLPEHFDDIVSAPNAIRTTLVHLTWLKVGYFKWSKLMLLVRTLLIQRRHYSTRLLPTDHYRPRLICNHCGRMGYREETCWKSFPLSDPSIFLLVLRILIGHRPHY